MSAILSADDLNDFISPGVACIKPVETLPKSEPLNPYEVTTEDKLPPSNLPAAQISLTDCLACSGCVTSAEAVLVSLQSHAEVLHALESYKPIDPRDLRSNVRTSSVNGDEELSDGGKIFVASVSPQVRASLAATYGISEREAGNMIEQMLSGPAGIKKEGKYGNGFTWVIDTNHARQACLVLGAEELTQSILQSKQKNSGRLNGAKSVSEGSVTARLRPQTPVLTSACPGWICYAEKTHPHVLPHLSRLKSPQALLGTMIKTTLSSTLGISPDRIWHLAIMPCFDKKLEASREELTDAYWRDDNQGDQDTARVRDVDCVITTKELLMLADSTNLSFRDLPRAPIPRSCRTEFPDFTLNEFLLPQNPMDLSRNNCRAGGSSGGYLFHILETFASLHPGSEIRTERGRNVDVLEQAVVRNGEVLLKTARYYGFRNIQNLVRKLKPAKSLRMPGARVGASARKPGALSDGGATNSEYAYVEVMACPGGCTNGGGQIKLADLGSMRAPDGDHTEPAKNTPAEQKAWLARVDEAYYSASDHSDDETSTNHNHASNHQPSLLHQSHSSKPVQDIDNTQDMIDGISTSRIKSILDHWSSLTGIPLEKLAYTSYRAVQSDVGKGKTGEMDRVVELAGRVGGGW